MIWLTIVLSMIAGYMVFWSGVISLIGFASWRPLADRYPADYWPEEGEGIALSWQTMSIGMSNYGNVLKAVVAVDGLYLQPARMFAFNHPPVFIPWGSIVGISKGFMGSLKLQLEDGKAISLRGKVSRYVEKALNAYDLESDDSAGGLLDNLGEEKTTSQQSSSGTQRARA